MGARARFLGQRAPLLRLQNAGLSRRENWRLLASIQKGLRLMGAATIIRRLFGTRGRAVRLDVLISEEVYGPLGGDRGKLKKQGMGQETSDGSPMPFGAK